MIEKFTRYNPNRPYVSVIVPIYNVERYLDQCLTALRNQTLRNLEIVAVNDGSTDSSLSILQAHALHDARIRIFSKPNEGYGATVNRGLVAARGEYIGIAEPDDYVEPTMYAKLLKEARRHEADIVKCDFFDLRGTESTPRNLLADMPQRQPIDPAAVPECMLLSPSIWAALYRRDMLDGYEGRSSREARRGGHGKTEIIPIPMHPLVRCRETPGAAFQDTAFTCEALCAARRIVFLNEPLLHYRRDNENASSQSTDKVNFVADEFAEAREWLAHDKERYRLLIAWLYLKQWNSQRWDYERLAPECRVECVARTREDFKRAAEAGDLNLDIFPLRDLEQLASMLEETPERFVELNPETY